MLLNIPKQAVTTVCTWDKLHRFKLGGSAPCTCLATRDEWIASGGEDGKAVLLAIEQRTPLQTLGNDCFWVILFCFCQANDNLY